MKIETGIILKRTGKNDIVIEMANGDLYQMLRTSAIKIYDNGRVDFEKWKAFRVEQEE